MNDTKNPTTGIDPVEYDAAMKDAKNNPDTYTHVFAHPFTYGGRTYEKLTFDWGKLTGADDLAIQNEIAIQGKPLVAPEFSGESQVKMAVRACTERDSEGRRVIGVDTMQAMPIQDHRRICSRARSFLLKSGR